MCQSEARNTKVLLAANTSDVQWEIHLYIGCQKSDETGGRESKGRSGLMKLSKLVQNGKIWRSWMTDSNSVELFHVEFFFDWEPDLQSWNIAFLGVRSPNPLPKASGLGNLTTETQIEIQRSSSWATNYFKPILNLSLEVHGVVVCQVTVLEPPNKRINSQTQEHRYTVDKMTIAWSTWVNFFVI